MDNVQQWHYIQTLFSDHDVKEKAIKIQYDTKFNIDCRYPTTRVDVVKRDTLEAARELANPLVLILADDERPGGCVQAGAGMQEESLFRRTALYKYLTRDLYPIEKDKVIYARNVPLLTGNTICFIACPGIKMPQLTNDNKLCETDEFVLRRKIELILQVANKYGHSSIVLGALGCGVWGCPPKHVANIMKNVLMQYKGSVLNVVVAVLGSNYNIFSDVFETVVNSSDTNESY